MQRRPISKSRRSATLDELILVGSATNSEVADAGVPRVGSSGTPSCRQLVSFVALSYVLFGVYVLLGATVGAEAPELRRSVVRRTPTSRLSSRASRTRRWLTPELLVSVFSRWPMGSRMGRRAEEDKEDVKKQDEAVRTGAGWRLAGTPLSS